jgi:hypothetical protein
MVPQETHHSPPALGLLVRRSFQEYTSKIDKKCMYRHPRRHTDSPYSRLMLPPLRRQPPLRDVSETFRFYLENIKIKHFVIFRGASRCPFAPRAPFSSRGAAWCRREQGSSKR